MKTDPMVSTCSQICEYEVFFHRAHCDQRALSFVPRSSGCENVSLLELQGNNITAITNEQMSGYLHVRTLDISRNQISSLEPGTFHSNNHLRNVLISHNNLDILRNYTFNGTEKDLQRIYLDNNKLRMIEKGALEGLTKLKILRLERNFLTYIPEGLLFGLFVLHQVNLSFNQLNDTAFPENFGFHNLPILDVRYNHFHRCSSIVPYLYNVTDMLHVDGNPFLCDCNCKIIQKWLDETYASGERTPSAKVPVTCKSSNGTYVGVTESLALNCDDTVGINTTPSQTTLSHFHPVLSDADLITTRKDNIKQLTGHGKEANISLQWDHVDHIGGPTQAQQNKGVTLKELYRAHWTSYYTAVILTLYFLVLSGRWARRIFTSREMQRYPENMKNRSRNISPTVCL
ncbi:Slit-like 2 protein [Holothuria leucospilota]|uniref:Slit-like 2 protein n=1 Tax=Holothuria leucospilota TaxID=206669 RepID=A0A9Q1BJ52_HOLLE|nr:Slit-like 2 protein [Holothuria leucospilota]